MPEIRMDELLGPEASPRPGFEDELAARLHRGWHRAERPRRRWLQVGMAVAAVATATALVVVLTGRDGPKTVTVDTSPVTSPATTVAETVTTAAQPPTSVIATSDAQQTVLDYLRALAEGRWADAALPLWEGGLEPEARADLRPLFAPEYGLRPGEVTHEALAAALQRWCADGCGTLVAGLSEPREGVVVVTFDFGVPQRSAVFTAGTFEGQPLVNGLPLRVPAGVDPATIVDCASAGSPLRALSADLDGDGWSEQIVVVDIPTHIGSTIMVCGTDLEVALMDVPAEPQVWIAVVRDGFDVLLIDGRAYAFDGTALVDQGVDASFVDSFATGSGASVGCGAWGGSERVRSATRTPTRAAPRRTPRPSCT
ncbi:MAG: hypothetical protein R2694_09365 [Ilumatobacteraceae bacterium]